MERQPVQVRLASQADYPAVIEVTYAAYAAQRAKSELYAYVYTETVESLTASQAKHPNWQILVVEEADQLVAAVRVGTFKPTDTDLHLWRLSVTPEAQGRGYGKLLVQTVEQWASAQGYQSISLGALEVSPENQAMYERWGYRYHERREMTSAPGNFYAILHKPTDRKVNQTVATYEIMAEDYQQRRGAVGPWVLESLDRFKQQLAAPAKILEVGCGPGRDARLLRESGYQVVALDPTWAMLQLAKQADVPLIAGDSRSLPIAAASVQGIWAQASLLHLPHLEFSLALSEIARVLQPNGVCYLSLKVGDGEQWHADGRLFAFHQPELVTKALAGVGLTVLDQWVVDADLPDNPPWVRTIARKEHA
ncbi:GNAT family N-acetyltransferase [Herpetosiphon llansteffanensis]